MLTVREGTERDIIRYAGAGRAASVLAQYPRWRITVVERNGSIIGIGGALWGHDDTCWLFIDASTSRYAKTMHQQATRILQSLTETENVIYAWKDDVPTAAKWMQRLGFEYDHTDSNGLEIWKWER